MSFHLGEMKTLPKCQGKKKDLSRDAGPVPEGRRGEAAAMELTCHVMIALCESVCACHVYVCLCVYMYIDIYISVHTYLYVHM